MIKIHVIKTLLNLKHCLPSSKGNLTQIDTTQQWYNNLEIN